MLGPVQGVGVFAHENAYLRLLRLGKKGDAVAGKQFFDSLAFAGYMHGGDQGVGLASAETGLEIMDGVRAGYPGKPFRGIF